MTARPRIRAWTGLLAIVGGLVRFAPPAAAQEVVVLPGQVLDAAGQPVGGLEVILHRVTPSGGALVAHDTTDPAGRFELRAAADDAEPVYFVAARYDGELQIGPMLRAPFPEGSDYVLRVGGPARGESNLPAVIPVVVFLALGGFAFARAFRPPERRRLLLRLAEIEEARAAGTDAGAHGRERDRILARLRHGPAS